MNQIRQTGSQEAGLQRALLSQGPATDRADKMSLYGWMIGDWEMDYTYHLPDGSKRTGTGSIHSGWALQGCAIQDVWRIPGPHPDGPDDPAKSLMYGTTLRVYDPAIDAWHIVWTDPVKQYYSRQVGRRRGDDIVQEGVDADGSSVRWTFTDMKPDAFHWIGERSSDGGKSWRTEVDFFVRRTR